MKIQIKPLKGKYYGTEIEVLDGTLKGMSFSIWHNTGNPSERQLEQWSLTRQQWVNDELIDNGWGGKSKISQMDFMTDSHYESQETFEFANNIVKKSLDL